MSFDPSQFIEKYGKKIKCRCLEHNPLGPNKQGSQSFGLKISGTKYKLPLKHTSYETTILNGIASTELTQSYCNPFDVFLEVDYFFPISGNVCFSQFKCLYEGKEIIGVIKEKEKAKEEYAKHLSQGNAVSLTEIMEKEHDVMKVSLGNIEPFKELTVKLSFIEKLKVCSSNKLWQHTIYSELRPRYGQSQNYQSTSSAPLTEIKKCDEHPPTTWEIVATIFHQGKLSFVRSSTHEITVDPRDNYSVVKLDTGKAGQNIPVKDFILYFSDETMNRPTSVIGKSNSSDKVQRYSALITFVPNFSNLEADDAFKSQLSNQGEEDFDLNIDSARGEYIFLLDRSGSMSGRRIEMAKEALILFLKSLPVESYYNIVSFGSRFKFLHQKSEKATDTNVSGDINQIKNFAADMGGTELTEAFSSISKMESLKGYPRQVFILTDGSIARTDELLHSISLSAKRLRVNTIGVGSGASAYLIEEGAKRGRGKSLMIQDEDDMTGKIIDLLQKTLSPCLDDFVLDYDNNIIEIIAPNPKEMGAVMKNEPFALSVFLEEKVQAPFRTDLKLKFFDSFLNKSLEYTVPVEISSDNFHPAVYKYCTHVYLKSLSDSAAYNQDYSKDVYVSRKIDLEKEIVEISIREQILHEKTAFITVIKEINDETKQEFMDKGSSKVSVTFAWTLSDTSHSLNLNSSPVLLASPQKKAMHSVRMFCGSFNSYSDSDSDSDETTIKTAFKQKKGNDIWGGPYLSVQKNEGSNKLPAKGDCKPLCTAAILAQKQLRLNEKDDLRIRLEEERLNREEEMRIQMMEMERKCQEEERCIKKQERKTKKAEGTSYLTAAQMTNKETEEKKLKELIQGAKLEEPKLIHNKGQGPDISLMEILILQRQSGLWEFQENLLQLLGLSKQEAESSVPQILLDNITDRNEALELFISIYVLAWLLKYCGDKRARWGLLEKKTRTVLDNRLKKELKIEWEKDIYNKILEKLN